MTLFRLMLLAFIMLFPVSGCSASQPTSAFKITGRLTEKVATEFEKYNEIGGTLIITSPGGLVDYAAQIGRRVKQLKLNVIVEKYCMSGCSQFVLPAAETVTLSGKTIIGIHNSPYSITKYLDKSIFANRYKKSEAASYVKIELDFYKEIGVSPEFIADNYGYLNIICMTPKNMSDYGADILVRFADFYVPSKASFENWIGKKINGQWPETPSEFQDFLAVAFEGEPTPPPLTGFGAVPKSDPKDLRLCTKEDLKIYSPKSKVTLSYDK
jgi:hypothetical protein